jgi:hypothetical protein
MPYTVPALIAAHQGVLDKLKLGSAGTARIDLYASTTLLISLAIDHATSAVNATTGQLVLAPGSAGVGIAAGTATLAKLVARDGTVLDDAVGVIDETAAAADPPAAVGKIIVSNLAVIVGGSVTLTAATIG